MLKVGDWVRVVPNSYIFLSKAGLNHPHFWNESDYLKDQYLMLGGRYKILSIDSDEKQSWYSLLTHGVNNSECVLADSLALDKELSVCPFSVGEKVTFNPNCSSEDMQYLMRSTKRYYDLFDSGRIYEVTSVLNDQYIFLDYPKQHECAYPFRWVDFQRTLT